MISAEAYILALNAGSSSLKFALFAVDGLVCVLRGSINGTDGKPAFRAHGVLLDQKKPLLPDWSGAERTVAAAAHMLLHWLETFIPVAALRAVAHRVVHGGTVTESRRVTPDLLTYLESLTPLAPLHQPQSLKIIHLLEHLYPALPQIVCFDTAFHATMPELHRRFALPRVWHERGVRRYGFHGLSYEHAAGQLRKCAPAAFAGRAIVAHLGSGASLCALHAGKSLDTSMGFSALDGLVMGTRPGTLDAGVVLYFLRVAGMNADAIEHLLYHESGLRGVSGISADMEILLNSADAAAREAVDLFCLRVAREAGGLISMLGGLDALVFTGGIGEHAASIRQQIVTRLGWTGLELDAAANAEAHGDDPMLLCAAGSRVAIWMIPADEESVMARHARTAMAAAGQNVLLT